MAVAGCITQGQSELLGRIHYVRFALLWRNVDFRQTYHHCSSLWCSVSFNIYCGTNALKASTLHKIHTQYPKLKTWFVCAPIAKLCDNRTQYSWFIHSSKDFPLWNFCIAEFFLFRAHSWSIKKKNSWINHPSILGAIESNVLTLNHTSLSGFKI